MSNFNICGRCANQGEHRKELSLAWVRSFDYTDRCDVCGMYHNENDGLFITLVVAITIPEDHPLIIARQKINGHDLLGASLL